MCVCLCVYIRIREDEDINLEMIIFMNLEFRVTVVYLLYKPLVLQEAFSDSKCIDICDD